PDDDHGCPFRCLAAGLGDGNRIGTAKTSRHHHCRRTHRKPTADPLHDAGGLSPAGQPEASHSGSPARRTPSAGQASNMSRPIRIGWAIFPLALTGCTVGPKYHPPATTQAAPVYKESPTQFKEGEGWKVAQPRDAMLRGKWWEIFHDP